MKKRLGMEAQLQFHEIDSDAFDFRNVQFEDCAEMGRLDLLTITNTIEFDGETEADTIHEMKETFHGKYGEFMPSASFAIEDHGKIVSATIFCLSEESDTPFLAYAMTHPEFQNKGLSQFLLKQSMNVLAELGHHKASLCVMKNNSPAISVYQKLGYKFMRN